MTAGLDLLGARVVFRDRAVTDVCDLALRFVAGERATYARVALVTLAPLAAAALAFGAVAGWRWSWLAAVPLALAAEVPFTVLASRLVFAADVRARDVLAEAARRAPALIASRLALALLSVAGLVFALVPGIWIALLGLFVPEVMLLERSGLAGAFQRSQRIANAAFGESLVALGLLALVPVAAVLLGDFGARMLLGELLEITPPPAVWSAGGSALAVLALFLQAPYRATARFFLYLNVRTRAEGWDIQTRFAGLAARAEGP